jgi:hypothetical protein
MIPPTIIILWLIFGGFVLGAGLAAMCLRRGM